MNSRDKILSAVKTSQPAFIELQEKVFPGQTNSPVVPGQKSAEDPGAGDLARKFISVLESIGGEAHIVSHFEKISLIIQQKFGDAKRIVSSSPQLSGLSFGKAGAVIESGKPVEDPHTLEDIDLAILRAHFGVAENSACWITEDLMIERVMPFICQHLALIINKKDIVSTMKEAYSRIAEMESSGSSYGFGAFIAGPSKTADIEQSLVLGAHGPKTMMIFILDQDGSDAGFY